MVHIVVYTCTSVGGKIYSLSVSIPFPEIPFQSWHPMVAFYTQQFKDREQEPTISKLDYQVQSVLRQAFQKTKDDIVGTEPGQCNCSTRYLNENTIFTVLYITAVQ